MKPSKGTIPDTHRFSMTCDEVINEILKTSHAKARLLKVTGYNTTRADMLTLGFPSGDDLGDMAISTPASAIPDAL